MFITKDKTQDDRPLFYAFVNGITEKPMPSGGNIKTYRLGTSAKMQDGTYRNSTWFTTLMGNARKENDNDPLVQGDRIAVYGFKQENYTVKKPDGSYSSPYFNMQISDYALMPRAGEEVTTSEYPEEDAAY